MQGSQARAAVRHPRHRVADVGDGDVAIPRPCGRKLFRACRSRRGDKGRNDRKFLEALHYFTVHNITWRALPAEYDESASIGKRYRRQDEIGTPWALTIDHQTLEDGTVTLRDRDTLEQERIPLDGARALLLDRLEQPWRPRA